MDSYVTTTDILSRLEALGNSPLDHGRLEMIVCRPAIEQRKVLECAELDLLEGLVGDSWRARGSSRTEDGSPNFEAQITIMNSRIIQVLAQDRSRWPLAGDQLYIDLDLSIENLPPGQRIAIGTAVLEVSATPHTGCAKFTERFGHDAIRFVNSAEGRQGRRRGLNARVIEPGTICVGDIVSKIGE